MLLRNACVKEAVRIYIMESLESYAFLHRRRDRNDLRVPLRQLDHDCGKDIRPCRLGFLRRGQARFYVEGTGAVKSRGVALRRLIPFALCRDDMDNDCLVDALCILENMHHLRNVVTVDRPKVRYAHVFEHHARNHELF